jgi:hypothetical protein
MNQDGSIIGSGSRQKQSRFKRAKKRSDSLAGLDLNIIKVSRMAANGGGQPGKLDVLDFGVR